MSSSFVTAIRRNHALEHATIGILMTKLGAGTRMMGHASVDGFYVVGDVSTEDVAEAAHEGLARLKRGEHHLAVSPLCGTNLVTAGLLAGLASMLSMRRKRGMSHLPQVVLAATGAVILAQPLGRMAQKHLTTFAEVEGVDIVGVTSSGHGQRTRHKIRTVQDQPGSLAQSDYLPSK